MRTFVDTDVWVYALDRRDASKQRAAIAAIEEDPASIVVSPQVMGELYVTMVRLGRQPVSDADADAAVEALGRFTVVPIDADQVAAAIELRHRHQISYWDALIVASARAAGCRRLLTEDLAHGTELGGVRVENPFLPRRLAEWPAPYKRTTSAWDDEGLRGELARYEEAARASGMKPNALHSYWDYARRFLDWREGAYPRQAAGRPVPARRVAVAELHEDADAYRRSLGAAGLSQAAMDTYVRHADFFVRWLEGTFEPGARLRRR